MGSQIGLKQNSDDLSQMSEIVQEAHFEHLQQASDDGAGTSVV